MSCRALLRGAAAAQPLRPLRACGASCASRLLSRLSPARALPTGLLPSSSSPASRAGSRCHASAAAPAAEEGAAGAADGEAASGRKCAPQRSRAWRSLALSLTPFCPLPLRLRVLSGVQPTGSIHLGNYLGAIRGWVALQETYDPFFCVVDLHAITAPHSPAELAASTRANAALYLAAGVDPARATVFVQSHVAAHSELAWLLNCVTPVGWLNKMIQFKEKSRKQGEDCSVGLMDYPVLMAADILLYGADLVPVGEDQRQHLELTRDIAARFNSLYGGKPWKKRGGLAPGSGKPRGGRIFKVPEALIPPAGARVMSLDDGSSKMSKSNPAEGSRINLLDPPDVISSKVKRCKTDTGEGLVFDDPERPESQNLLTIYQLVTARSKEEVAAECAQLRWSDFKPRLADALVAHLQPLQQRYAQLRADDTFLDDVLAAGAEKAAEVAAVTLADARDALGFVPTLRRRA
jgi:tryptophanyl-tRNA synthetase